MIRDLERKEEVMLNLPGMHDRVRVGGTIDRLGESEGTTHIIDYKTGSADRIISSTAQLFERDSWPSGKKFKGVLQTFLYAWIHSMNSEGKPVKPELYVAGELFREDYSPDIILKKGRSAAHTVIDFNEVKEEFGRLVTGLIGEIFNPDVPFSQTEDEKRCAYCPYAQICHRDGSVW